VATCPDPIRTPPCPLVSVPALFDAARAESTAAPLAVGSALHAATAKVQQIAAMSRRLFVAFRILASPLAHVIGVLRRVWLAGVTS
jgi:hypothetical protein